MPKHTEDNENSYVMEPQVKKNDNLLDGQF